MSQAATPYPVDRGDPAAAHGTRPSGSGTPAEIWLRPTRSSTCSCSSRITVVVVFSFNATDRRVTDWDGLSLRWYEHVLGDKIIQGYPGTA